MSAATMARGRVGKRERITQLHQSPLPHDFRPKHCAGESDDNNGCLHMHPGDSICACGRVVIPAGIDARLLRPGDSPALLGQTYRHSTFGCSTVSAASVAR